MLTFLYTLPDPWAPGSPRERRISLGFLVLSHQGKNTRLTHLRGVCPQTRRVLPAGFPAGCHTAHHHGQRRACAQSTGTTASQVPG